MDLEGFPHVYYHKQNIVYPTIDNQHIVIKPKGRSFEYNEDFPYRLNSPKDKFIKFILKFFMICIAFPVCKIRYALKVKGRKNIKAYKKITKSKGIISVCNHTAEWDTLFCLMTRNKFAEFPIWQEGAESKNGKLYRYAGGIVMPKHSLRGMYYSYKAMLDVIKEDKWLHIFPEAACWPFYPAIREFEIGAFKAAYETNRPILPMGVKYRPNRGLYKLFKKHPNATITIGEPLVPNYALNKSESINDLKNRAMASVMKLIGISSVDENNKLRKKIYSIQGNN